MANPNSTIPTPDPPAPAGGRPLRVLQVVHRFLPELGGTETHVAEVTRRLAGRDDIDVTVATTDRSGRLPAHDVVNGVPVHRHRAWPRERDYYLAPALYREIRTGEWDLVHFQGIHTLVPALGMRAARRAGRPYVVTFHSGGHSSAGRTALRGPQFRALAPLLRDADGLIAVSRFERSRFAAAAGIPAERFRVVGNGGSLPGVAGGIAPVPGRIVSSGRLEQYKGHHRLVEALPAIRRARPGAQLVILGAGPYESELRRLVDRVGVADAVRIQHLPPADRGAMARELAAAHVMAAMSRYEAHPVGVMEAVATGLPVLGADVAGIGDLVADGLVTGVPVDLSTAALAAALVDMLDRVDPADPRTRPTVDLPTWDSCTAAVADLYHDVIRRRAAR